MLSMWTVNKDGQIGLIIYGNYDLQNKAIYLGRAVGKVLRNVLLLLLLLEGATVLRM